MKIYLFKFFYDEYNDKTDEEIQNIIKNDRPLTFNKSKKFFEKFKLGLRVINNENDIIAEYKPDKFNKHIDPKILN